MLKIKNTKHLDTAEEIFTEFLDKFQKYAAEAAEISKGKGNLSPADKLKALECLETRYETFVWSGAHVHPAHTHRISAHTHEIDDHTHRVSAHTHTVKDHTHTVKDHTHAIEFGIYEGQRASKATIKVDGKEIPAPSSYSNIDIVEYLATDSNGKIRRNSWHSIEILPDNMSRIVGAVFAQTFCNSRGGGDY